MNFISKSSNPFTRNIHVSCNWMSTAWRAVPRVVWKRNSLVSIKSGAGVSTQFLCHTFSEAMLHDKEMIEIAIVFFSSGLLVKSPQGLFQPVGRVHAQHHGIPTHLYIAVIRFALCFKLCPDNCFSFIATFSCLTFSRVFVDQNKTKDFLTWGSFVYCDRRCYLFDLWQ